MHRTWSAHSHNFRDAHNIIGALVRAAATAFTVIEDGVLEIELSPSPGTGLLLIDGTLDLNTTDDSLRLASSVGIAPETYYRIVSTTGGITGQFESVSPGFEVEYRNNHTEIWARYVPEPASAVAIGLLILLSGRRR